MALVKLYDTTLRDGAQSEGISFSLVDKLHIAAKLDELGVHYIEEGWPGSNPKDAEFYQKATNRRVTSRWSETRFYQGLSFSKLGQKDKAEEIFNELVDTAKEKLSQKAAVDVFAKFGRQQTEAARKASAHYALGLGYLGKGLPDKAKAEFEKAVTLNVSHIWAKAQLAELK